MNRIIPIALAALAVATIAPTALSAQKRGAKPTVAADTAKPVTRRAMIDTAAIRRKLRYPDRQLRIGAWGQVSAAIDVTPAGKAKVIAITGSREGSGEPIDPFAQAVDRALNRKLKATPAMLDGVRVRDTVWLLFTFSLIKGEKGKMVGAIGITDAGKSVSLIPRDLPGGLTPEIGDRKVADNGGRPRSGNDVEIAEEFVDVLGPLAATEGPFPKLHEKVKVDEEATYDSDELTRMLKYPEIARRNGIEGTVVVYALIGRTGRVVTTVFGKSDSQKLGYSASEGVRQTHFTPAKRDGKPVATWVEIPVSFRFD